MIQNQMFYSDADRKFVLWLSQNDVGANLTEFAEPLIKQGYRLRRCATIQEFIEKIEIFEDGMFLVPSAMLSALTTVTSQNIGAGKKERAVSSLKFGMLITVSFGILMCLLANLMPSVFTGIFTKDQEVIIQADQYFRTYSIDCILAGITFCINGYLCGIGKSSITFMHNVISIFTVRIPCAWILSRLYPSTLSPMGLASPLGSVMSLVILTVWYYLHKKKICEL